MEITKELIDSFEISEMYIMLKISEDLTAIHNTF